MAYAGENSNEIPIYNAAESKVEFVKKIFKSEKEWKKILTTEQFQVTRQEATEKPFSGKCTLPEPGKSGIYRCVCCGTDLFLADNKFESSTGWPSFWDPASQLNIKFEEDNSMTMKRIAVSCARCSAHLGHMFYDGPPPTFRRYCINAVSLKFYPVDHVDRLSQAIFAAGCFWGVESIFEKIPGVISTRVGYTGGIMSQPSYEDVCTNKTGHAEAVEIEFNPKVVSYKKLLDIFWQIHDPTTLNRQGPDVGTQYRSAIFTMDARQEEEAKKSLDDIEKSGRFKGKIVTQIMPAMPFYDAEEYHQHYSDKNGGAGCRVIDLH